MAVAAAFLAGGLSGIKSRPALFLGLFLLWAMFGIPLSVWRGGSVQQMRTVVQAFVLLIPIAGLCTNFLAIRKTFTVFGFSILVFSVLTLLGGDDVAGRLSLDSGTFANSNDLAQVVLLGLPFWAFAIAEWRKAKPILALPMALGFLPMLAAIGKTGSRALIVALAVVAVVLFFRITAGAKIKLVLAAALAVTLAVPFLPKHILLRYMTFFTPAAVQGQSIENVEAQLSAIESTQGRMELFKDSLRMTASHPIFGVGIGMFSVANGKLREEENVFGAWKVSHNAYTQISSECGILALIFYLLAVWHALRLTSRARKYQAGSTTSEAGSIRNAALALELAFISFLVFACFLSIAYMPHVFVLAAFAVALERVSAQSAAVARPATPLGARMAPFPYAPSVPTRPLRVR
jgi:O-antigen ligase/polysaccharide polymerase Wzy-like membrane protein